jgi:hypothetical protein
MTRVDGSLAQPGPLDEGRFAQLEQTLGTAAGFLSCPLCGDWPAEAGLIGHPTDQHRLPLPGRTPRGGGHPYPDGGHRDGWPARLRHDAGSARRVTARRGCRQRALPPRSGAIRRRRGQRGRELPPDPPRVAGSAAERHCPRTRIRRLVAFVREANGLDPFGPIASPKEGTLSAANLTSARGCRGPSRSLATWLWSAQTRVRDGQTAAGHSFGVIADTDRVSRSALDELVGLSGRPERSVTAPRRWVRRLPAHASGPSWLEGPSNRCPIHAEGDRRAGPTWSHE